MWPNPQFPADFIKFTEEIRNGKPNVLGIVHYKMRCRLLQNAAGILLLNSTILLQNVTVTTKCDNYCKIYVDANTKAEPPILSSLLIVAYTYFFL